MLIHAAKYLNTPFMIYYTPQYQSVIYVEIDDHINQALLFLSQQINVDFVFYFSLFLLPILLDK